ncbi:MAG: biotin--[acetyl-CoA-carboxylase] ligase [Thermosulfidibacteraceae bacterium]|jgi:BirA family biotin operon repressor/biotin-[acetyl-CoA-carboxylase] ligase
MQRDYRNVDLITILTSRKGEVVSGEELAINLGISRVAVWKRVRELVKEGFPIKVIPRRGYMLLNDMSDSLRPEFVLADLKTRVFGRNYYYFDIVDSTNTFAMGLAEKGAPHGTVVVAESQLSGRGRLGRRWYSPPGKNIYMSVLVNSEISTLLGFRMTMMAGCAVCESLRSIGLPALIKWPNDVYVNNRKIAGILTETIVKASSRINSFIIGIGINVNMRKEEIPPYILDKATSVFIEKGEFYPRRNLLISILASLEKWYNACLNKLEEAWMYWRFNNYTIGKRVRVDGKKEGEAIGVTPFGELLVKFKDGNVDKITTGDITVITGEGEEDES